MSFSGINAADGKRLDGVAHLQQSIKDILTTRIGTRVMRREYGSNLFKLIDRPLNEVTKTDIFAEVAIALQRWEPRFLLNRVYVESVTDQGQIVIALEGKNLVDGKLVTIEGLKL